MLWGPYRFVLQVLASLAVGGAVCLGALLLRVSAGPVSMGWMTPLLEQSLASGPVRVTVGDTLLGTGARTPGVYVQAVNVRILDRDSGQTVAAIPGLGVRFGLRALLQGVLAPATLVVEQARLRVVRDRDGHIDPGFLAVGPENGAPDKDGPDKDGPDRAAQAGYFFQALLRAPDHNSATGFLRTIRIVDSSLELIDRHSQRRWLAKTATLTLRRDARTIRGAIDASLLTGDAPLHLEADGQFDLHSRTTTLNVGFGPARPVTLSTLHPALADLARIDMPVDGSLVVGLTPAGRLASLTYELFGGAGDIRVPGLDPEAIRVSGLYLKGRAARHFSSLTIDEALLDLDGVTAGGKALLRRDPEGSLYFDVEADMTDVPMATLDDLWPAGLAPAPRAWVTENLTAGMARQARIRLRGRQQPDDAGPPGIDSLDGVIDFDGLTAHYLRPMPPATGLAGRARFDADSFRIRVEAGRVETGSGGTLGLDSAQVDLLNLASADPVADIRLLATGPASAALQLIDSDPLGFAAKMDLVTTGIEGIQATRAALRVPLRKDVRTDDVEAAAASRLTGFGYARGVFGLPVSQGDISLHVDNRGLRLAGGLNLNRVPLEVSWEHVFATATDAYRLQGVVDDIGRDRLNVRLPPWIAGPVGVALTYRAGPDGNGTGRGEVELREAAIALDRFGWRKPPGGAGQGRFDFSMTDGTLAALTAVDVEAPALRVRGDLTFTPAGEVARVDFASLVVGETDLAGRLSFDGNTTRFEGEGRALDLRPWRASLSEATPVTDPATDPATGPNRTAPAPPPEAAGESGERFELVIGGNGIQTVRFDEALYLTGLRGHLTHAADRIELARLTAGVRRPDGDGSDPVSLTVTPGETGRNLDLRAADAGHLIRGLGWVQSIHGGTLRVEAGFDDFEPGRPAFGAVRMENFQVIEAPVLARLLTLGSFQGISDVMSGQGITFRQMEIPFRLAGGRLDIRNARARGSAIGILAEGHIDTGAGTLDLRGELAPDTILNTLLGRIPIIGDMLTGGEGIFAATYTVSGSLESPEVAVNPLSVLTPGITRRIISGFGQSAEIR